MHAVQRFAQRDGMRPRTIPGTTVIRRSQGARAVDGRDVAFYAIAREVRVVDGLHDERAFVDWVRAGGTSRTPSSHSPEELGGGIH